MGYDWAERYVLKNCNYVLVWGLISFSSKMYEICTLEFQWSALLRRIS